MQRQYFYSVKEHRIGWRHQLSDWSQPNDLIRTSRTNIGSVKL